MSGLPTPVDPSDPRAGLADVTGQWTEMHNRCHELVAELRVRPAGDDTAPPAETDDDRVALAAAMVENRSLAALLRVALHELADLVDFRGHRTPVTVLAAVGAALGADAGFADRVSQRAASEVGETLSGAGGAAAGPRAGDTAPADAEAVVAWWSPSTRRFIVEHPGVGWLAIPSDGGAHRADYPADAVRLVADGSRAGDTAPDDIPDTRETFELLVPEPPTADVVEVRPRKWGDGPWCRDGMEWARGNYRLTWAQLLHKYSDRGVEVARRVEARDTSSADEPSCPDHGPGEHVTGQAFGAGREWFCTLCDDTFLWVRPTTAAAPVSDTSSTLRHLAGELRDGPPAWLPAGADTSWCGDVASWLEYHADRTSRDQAASPAVRDDLDQAWQEGYEANTTDERLRSEAAALRAAGDELAEGVHALLPALSGRMCPVSATTRGTEALRVLDAWRSAAGSPTPANPLAAPLPVTLSSVDDVVAVCLAHGLAEWHSHPTSKLPVRWGTNEHVIVGMDQQGCVLVWRAGLAVVPVVVPLQWPTTVLVAAIEAARGGPR